MIRFLSTLTKTLYGSLCSIICNFILTISAHSSKFTNTIMQLKFTGWTFVCGKTFIWRAESNSYVCVWRSWSPTETAHQLRVRCGARGRSATDANSRSSECWYAISSYRRRSRFMSRQGNRKALTKAYEEDPTVV